MESLDSKMTDHGETAYITGGASGIGRAVAEMLVKKGVKVFLADRDVDGAQSAADDLNKMSNSQMAYSAVVDTADWNSQAKAFGQAVTQFGRIDYVYPIAGIGERRWLPLTDPQLAQTGFEAPDLTVLQVDLTGVLYTVAIAIQQFRRQEEGKNGLKGKIGCVASVCGFYCAPTLPLYTAAKHAIVGFVRSYGKYLPQEKITLNAVCPNVVRTNISTGAFYDTLAEQNLLAPLQGVVDAFEMLFDGKEKHSSGEIFEVGPNYGKDNQKSAVIRAPTEYLDAESKTLIDLLEQRGQSLQTPH